MTVIKPNSVSGITSITAQANEINFFRSNGTLAGFNLNGVNFNTTSGISTFAALNIEGVLTYQDVTNVDSIGLITARSGINVTGGQLDVGSNIKLGNAGVVTATTFVGNLTGTATQVSLAAQSSDTDCYPVFALDATGNQTLHTKSNRLSFNSATGALSATSFVGDGSNLTGISAGTALSGSTNNTLVTVTGANAITGESTLTYNGSDTFELQPASATPAIFIGDSNRTGANQGLAQFRGNWNGTTVARITFDTGDDTTNKDDGIIRFDTAPSGSLVERLRITREGYLFVRDNGVTQTNTTLSYQSEGAFITHYTARTTAGGDKYRRMFDIASVGANPWGSSIRFLTSADSTNPAVTVERVRIDHNGRVGINKTTPRAMLSVKAERSATPRFGIDGHYSDSSYAQCSWDDSNGLYTLLGVNHQLDANGNDAGVVSSLHSASILLDGRSGNIRFNVKQNSGSSTTELMRIRDTGCVHIGNSLASAAAGRLQVVEERGGNQTNDCNAYFETNANDWNIKTYYNSAGTHYHIMFVEQGSNRGMISGSDGSNVTYSGGSDYRWKENIVEMTGTEGIDICKKLKPSKYNWIENREETGQINTVDGFIAHEVVEAGVLGAVTGEKDAVNEDGSIKGQMLDYGQMTPVLAAAIKGLITKVETLEAEVAALKSS